MKVWQRSEMGPRSFKVRQCVFTNLTHCQDWYSACELSRSYSDFGDVVDCLETDAGSEVEEHEAQAQLDELSH